MEHQFMEIMVSIIITFLTYSLPLITIFSVTLDPILGLTLSDLGGGSFKSPPPPPPTISKTIGYPGRIFQKFAILIISQRFQNKK